MGRVARGSEIPFSPGRPSGPAPESLKRDGPDADIDMGGFGERESYDNALAETIIGLYKTEVIRPRGPWRNLEAVEYATLEWADWLNNRRLLEPIGNVPPAEFEMQYLQQQTESAIPA